MTARLPIPEEVSEMVLREEAEAEVDFGDYWADHLPAKLSEQMSAICAAISLKEPDEKIARMTRYLRTLALEDYRDAI